MYLHIKYLYLMFWIIDNHHIWFLVTILMGLRSNIVFFKNSLILYRYSKVLVEKCGN